MERNKIIKYLGICVLLFFSILSVTALELAVDTNGLLPVDKTIYTNQIYRFDGTNVFSNSQIDILRNTIFSIPGKTLITSSILNTDNVTHNFKFSANSLTGGIILSSETINISPNSQRDFSVLTNINDEEVDIFFKCNDCVNNSIGSYSYNYQLLEKSEKGSIDDITTTFVGAMKDFIDIQIGFWKIIYYLFIFAIVLGTIGLLIGFGFKFYSWAEDLNEKKKEIWHGGNKK